jgi:hypothetical protein
MTGQVKEEVLTRLGELGLRVEQGCLVFRPFQLRDTEWLPEPTVFEFLDVADRRVELGLPAGSLAFTFCQVPVVYQQGDRLAVTAVLSDGREVAGEAGVLPADISAAVFQRDGLVERIAVEVPRT